MGHPSLCTLVPSQSAHLVCWRGELAWRFSTPPLLGAVTCALPPPTLESASKISPAPLSHTATRMYIPSQCTSTQFISLKSLLNQLWICIVVMQNRAPVHLRCRCVYTPASETTAQQRHYRALVQVPVTQLYLRGPPNHPNNDRASNRAGSRDWSAPCRGDWGASEFFDIEVLEGLAASMEWKEVS
jgi:hypothetical protein